MSVKKDGKRGSWYFVVDVAAVNGKRQQLRQRGFATKKAAEGAKTAVIADQARGTFVRPSRVTLEAFLFDEWLPAKRAGLRPSTANSRPHDPAVRGADDRCHAAVDRRRVDAQRLVRHFAR